MIEGENQESDISGRNTNVESSDSTTVKPEFDINGWEGVLVSNGRNGTFYKKED